MVSGSAREAVTLLVDTHEVITSTENYIGL